MAAAFEETAASLFARAGTAAGAWVVGWAYCLVLAVVPSATCGPPSSDPYLASTIVALPTGALVAVVGVGLRFRRGLRWLTLPYALLIPLAVAGAIPALGEAGAAMVHACGVEAGLTSVAAPTAWHRVWAPFHIALLGAIGIQAMRYWRPPEA